METGMDAVTDLTPLVFTMANGEGNLVAAVLVPGPDGSCDTLTLYGSGTLRRREGRMDGELVFLEEAGCVRNDDLDLPRPLLEAIWQINGGGPEPAYMHGPTFSMHAAKRWRKGVERAPRRASEKAWVRRHWPNSWERELPEKHAYLDFVRYMRWYAHRSYLARKLNGWRYDPDRQEFYARWPRSTP